MRGAAGRVQLQPEDPARRGAETAFGRLAVDEKPAPGGHVVRQLRAVAAALFADDEQQADARLALAPQPLGGGHLRGENALRIARSAAVQTIALDAAREERRHAVEVRGQHDIHPGHARRTAGGRDDVEPVAIDGLLGDRKAQLAQVPASHRPASPSRPVVESMSMRPRANAIGSTLRAPCACRCASRDT